MALNYLNIATTTLQAIRKNVADAVFLARPFTRWMMMNGRTRTQNGGKWIETPILYGKNTTVGAYRGYDTLTTAPTEELTMARYSMPQTAGSYSISGEEEMDNSDGPTRILPLLQWKARVLEDSFKEYVNGVFLAATASKDLTKEMLGLNEIIPQLTAESQGTLGGIAVTNTLIPGSDERYWWASKYPQVFFGDNTYQPLNYATDYAGTKGGLYRMFNNFLNIITEGLDKRTDLILTNQRVYEQFEVENADKMRYGPRDLDMLKVGFDNQMFKGIRMMWDPQVGGGVDSVDGNLVYFIRSADLEFVVHSQRNFVTTPFREPTNQDAKVAYMLLKANLICTNRRHQGVITIDDIPTA